MRNTFVKLLTLLVLALGGLYWVKTHGIAQLNSAPQTEASKRDQVPDISLTELSGTTRNLYGFKEKILLINFWATWCQACMEEMPSIVALRNKYYNQEFNVISINVDEKPGPTIQNLLKKFKMNFPVYIDPQGDLARIFDLQAIPLTLVVNRDHKILMSTGGEYDWNSAEFHAKLEKWLGN